MNRQAANYIESVGDNMHYNWQTPWHNRWCWIVTFGFLCGIVWLFYMQNKEHKEEFILRFDEYDKSLNLLDSLENVSAPLARFDVEIQHDFSGDLTQKTNMLNFSTKDPVTNKDLTRYVAICAKTQLDTANSLPPYFTYELKKDLKPNYLFYDTVNVDKILLSQIVLLDTYYDKIEYKGQFNDTIDYYCGNYKAQTITKKINKDIVNNMTFFFASRYIYNGKEYKDAHITPIVFYIGKAKWNRIFNQYSSCVNIKRNGLKLPEAKEKSLSISYQSPMMFDVVSPTPDTITSTRVIYSTPEKLQYISDNGLTIVARSIASANFQETLNFLYATMIGLMFSFLIEFTKRLYNYRRQKIYEAGWNYIPVVSIVISISLSIINYIRRLLNIKVGNKEIAK